MSGAGRGDLEHCGTKDKASGQQESTLAMARMKKEKSENVQVGWIGSPTEWQTQEGN